MAETKNNSQRGKGPMGGGPMGGMMGGGSKAKNFKGTSAKLGKYIGEYKIALILVFIFAICWYRKKL